MAAGSGSLVSLLGWAFVLRVLLLVYGAWHDTHLEVKYTDVDYDVFSDGAELVWHGQSPFGRSTYRYTPILALLLTPNIWAHPAFGKLLFTIADLAVGVQIYSILTDRRVPHVVACRCAGAWLFNPLSLNVSTRGNAESLVAVLLLASLRALLVPPLPPPCTRRKPALVLIPCSPVV
jgi:phosphatidylinositol glycan class M